MQTAFFSGSSHRETLFSSWRVYLLTVTGAVGAIAPKHRSASFDLSRSNGDRSSTRIARVECENVVANDRPVVGRQQNRRKAPQKEENDGNQ